MISNKGRKLLRVPITAGPAGVRETMKKLNAQQQDLDLALGLSTDINQIEILLDVGANPHHQYGTTGFNSWSAATSAALQGQSELLKLFLDRGTSSNTRMDGAGAEISILEFACLGGNMDCVTMLCERGAEVNYRNLKGEFALLYAAACGHLDIVEYLCNRGADPLQEDNAGRRAVDWAQRTIVSDEQLKLLSQVGSVNKSQLQAVVNYLKDRTK